MKTKILIIFLIFCFNIQAINNEDLITRLEEQAQTYKNLKSKNTRKPALVDIQVLPGEIVDLESEFTRISPKKTQKQATLSRPARFRARKRTRLSN